MRPEVLGATADRHRLMSICAAAADRCAADVGQARRGDQAVRRQPAAILARRFGHSAAGHQGDMISLEEAINAAASLYHGRLAIDIVRMGQATLSAPCPHDRSIGRHDGGRRRPPLRTHGCRAPAPRPLAGWSRAQESRGAIGGCEHHRTDASPAHLRQNRPLPPDRPATDGRRRNADARPVRWRIILETNDAGPDKLRHHLCAYHYKESFP